MTQSEPGENADMHHPDLYFPDGTLVIRSQDEDGGLVYFKVHQTILTKRSELMKNILKIPTPADEHEYYDGVQMVHSAGNPRDLSIVLKFIYEPFHPPMGPEDVDVAFTMLGALNLAHKFVVDELKDSILDHIRQDWPQTLAAWDERERVFYLRWDAAPHRSMDSYAPEPAAVIRVARLFDRTLLPVVFYHLSRTSVDTSYPNCSSDLEGADYSPRSARLELLSLEDRFKALAGRERMLGWLAIQFENLDLERWNQCTLGGCNCREVVILRLLAIEMNILMDRDPLNTLKSNFETGSNGLGGTCNGLCFQCSGEWDRWISEMRQQLFAPLSDFFLDL